MAGAGRATLRATHTIGTFRVLGDDLDPPEVTRILGLTPTHAHRKGDAHGRFRRRSGFWGIDSRVPRSGTVAQHCTELLAPLVNRADAIRELQRRAWFVGIHVSTFLGADRVSAPIRVDPDVSSRAAALGITIDVDVYPSGRPQSRRAAEYGPDWS